MVEGLRVPGQRARGRPAPRREENEVLQDALHDNQSGLVPAVFSAEAGGQGHRFGDSIPLLRRVDIVEERLDRSDRLRVLLGDGKSLVPGLQPGGDRLHAAARPAEPIAQFAGRWHVEVAGEICPIGLQIGVYHAHASGHPSHLAYVAACRGQSLDAQLGADVADVKLLK